MGVRARCVDPESANLLLEKSHRLDRTFASYRNLANFVWTPRPLRFLPSF